MAIRFTPFGRTVRPCLWSVALALCGISLTAIAQSSPSPTDASQCINIPARLDRLACFDALFGTPVTQVLSSGKGNLHSAAWQRAVNSEAGKAGHSGFSLHYANRADPGADIWMTASARHTSNRQVPILMLSCIDGISRAELILPTPSAEGKARVTISGRHGITRDWLSDEQGLVFRSGRGLPAIDIFRELLSAPFIDMRSDVAGLDNLTFDTGDLQRDILPMRKACRW